MTRTPSPVMRRTVAGLTLSAAALVGIVLHEGYTDRAVIPVKGDRKSTRLNSSHLKLSRMPSSA